MLGKWEIMTFLGTSQNETFKVHCATETLGKKTKTYQQEEVYVNADCRVC